MMNLINKETLDSFVQGDMELLADLATVFSKHMPNMAARMRVAVDDADANTLHECAHQLKSQLGYFAARNLQELAISVERGGRENQLDGIDQVADQLLTGCQQLLDELGEYTGLELASLDD